MNVDFCPRHKGGLKGKEEEEVGGTIEGMFLVTTTIAFIPIECVLSVNTYS